MEVAKWQQEKLKPEKDEASYLQCNCKCPFTVRNKGTRQKNRARKLSHRCRSFWKMDACIKDSSKFRALYEHNCNKRSA